MGPTVDASLLIVLRARDEAKGVLDGTKGSIEGIAKAGIALAATAAVAGVAVGGAAIKMAADFQSSMELIHTQAGASQHEVDSLKDAVLALAPTVGIGPEQLAAGLYHLESAGFRGATAMDALAGAAKLAQVGHAGLEETTQAVVGTLAAFPQYAGHVNDVLGILNATVGSGDMRMEGFAKALSTGILPAASTFGLGMKDVGAALATLTDNVTPPEEAATRLRMTFSLLGAQTPVAADHLKQIGIVSGELGQDMRKPNGLLVAIGDLRDHLIKTFGPESVSQINDYVAILKKDGPDAADKFAAKAQGAAEVISRSFGGGRSAGAIETLLTEFDRFQDKYKAIDAGATGFTDAWESTKNTFNQQMAEAKAALDSFMIKIGTALLPLVSSVAKWFTDNVLPALQKVGAWFADHGPAAMATFGAVLGKVVAFFQTDVLPNVQRFSTWISETAIPALQRFAGYLADNVVPILVNVGHTILDVATWIKDHLIPPLISFVQTVGPPIVDFFKFLSEHMGIVIGLIGVLVARLVVMKALNMGSEFLGWVNGIQMAEGGLSKLIAAVGDKGAAGALSTFRGKLADVRSSTSDVTPGLLGMSNAALGIVGGILAVGAAIVVLGTDAGGLRTKLKNAIWGEDQQQAINEATAQIHDFAGNLSAAFIGGGDDAAKAMNQTFTVIQNKLGDVNSVFKGQLDLAKLMPGVMADVKKGGLDALDALWSTAAKAGGAFAGLADEANHGATQMASDLMSAAEKGDQSWASATAQMKALMDDARRHHSSVTAQIESDFDLITAKAQAAGLAQVTQDAGSQDRIRSEFVDSATVFAQQQGLQGAAAKTFIDNYVSDHMAMFAKLHPEWAAASGQVDDLAKKLGLSRQAILDMGVAAAQENADMLNYLNDQIGKVTTLNGKIATLGSNMGSVMNKGLGQSTNMYAKGAHLFRPELAIVGDAAERIVPDANTPSWLGYLMDLAIQGRAPAMMPTTPMGVPVGAGAAGMPGRNLSPLPAASGGGDSVPPVILPVTLSLDGKVITRVVVSNMGKQWRHQGGKMGSNQG